MLVLIVSSSAFFIHVIRLWGPWSPIHLLAIFTLIMGPLGVWRAHRHDVVDADDGGWLEIRRQQRARRFAAALERIGIRRCPQFTRRNTRHSVGDGFHALVNRTEKRMMADES